MQPRSIEVFTVVQIVSIVLLFAFIFSRQGAWDWQREVGTVLMLVGIIGIATARYQLGRSFSITPQARQLVTHGVYSKIRNPIYFFGTILFAGLTLFLRRPVLWLLFVAIIIVQVVRARQEAEVLEAAFGDEYREYRRKTWF
jgi:protein-S-isoprenylcysteine O-methyltransferase Ste14